MVYGYLVYLCLSWFNLEGSINEHQHSAGDRGRKQTMEVTLLESHLEMAKHIHALYIYIMIVCVYTVSLHCNYIHIHIHIHVVFMYLFLSSILGGQLVHRENTRSKLEY